jgi:hypothetical protein
LPKKLWRIVVSGQAQSPGKRRIRGPGSWRGGGVGPRPVQRWSRAKRRRQPPVPACACHRRRVSSEARWATCQRPARTGTSCPAGVCVSAKVRLATCRRSLPSPSPVKQRRRNPAALVDDGLDCALVDGGLDCARVPVIVLYRWPFMCLACAADMSSSVPPLCPELAPRFERTSFLSKQRLQSGAR